MIENKKIEDNDILNKRLKNFCEENNTSTELFEIARIGTGEGVGEYKRLYGPKSVKNNTCIYVIKVFLKYNIVIIWNYKNNPNMTYSYVTIKNNLKKGTNTGDKGKFTHTNNQSLVFFDYTENFEKLLNKIINKIN